MRFSPEQGACRVATAKTSDQGCQQQAGRHERRCRIARQTHHQLISDPSEPDRFPRLDSDPGEDDIQVQRSEQGLREILLAHRRPAGNEHEVVTGKRLIEIGRESGWERMCKTVYIWWVT